MCPNITIKKTFTSTMCSSSGRRETSGRLLILAVLPNDGNVKAARKSRDVSVDFLVGNKINYPIVGEKNALQFSVVSERYFS